MANPQTRLIVEVCLDRARLVGFLVNVAQNRRLIDILINQDPSFELESAEARLSGATEAYRFRSVTVKKSDLLYAIPRETQEQVRARALYRTGMATQAQAAMPLGVLLPTCYISGTTLLPSAMQREKLHASQFQTFFAITNAVITAADGSKTEEPVVIVNRDAVLALGRLEDAA